ncbi:hypothetical protein ABB37_08460 [Leptomonas pyrrhocoris]|uniref:Uncharacterized protein n=1 Tax=Leptomonas pyrrhocoris TaxID=157538 RepID=A0A0N0VDG5_LEPPY|nr:hypothetical protein ABB37_08460 [Leptomonas pyrrhocoris]KPA75578.1 hypothetical protein ABB37_08460 [Leptomonas pyrrhocoris]|eukprot:XP_015654017.1 hypothetical protein ABB37_08460 [Leptomonas pyrrhocoris]
MGNGASSDSRAGTERAASRPHSAAAGAPRKQRVLANQAPRRSTNSFRSPAAIKEADVSRGSAAHSTAAKSMALQHAAVQRRAEVNPKEEDAIRAFTRNADPKSLRVLQLIQQADAVPPSNPAEKLRLLRQCYPLLEEVPKERFDQLAVTVYQQEGDIYYQQMNIPNAKDTFSRAITLAEKRVARQDTDMYMVLKRYVLAMIGMARIWYDHERDHQGFKFVDRKNPKIPAVDPADSDDGSSSLSSLESSLSSDGGSVFSLNEAIMRSMAPRPPRRQTGPLFKRLKVKAPHMLKNAQFDREDEFVLHSRMTRELVASPCELLLLRCCEVVQIGHNAQSELLIPPLIELAQIYEDLELYSRALLLVRRCLGILCSVYDYDHPWVVQLMQRADRLKALLEEQLRNDSATKIQATWKMHKAMEALADALGHPVKRHLWIPRKYRATPELDYLGDFVGDMPDDGLLGDDSVEPEADLQDPRTWAMVPQTAPVPEVSLSSDRARPVPSYEGGELQRPSPAALEYYAPVEHHEDGETFTAMVPNASVVGTTQDTQTDTEVRHTELGDVLTLRTTTVTKTITAEVARSDDDEGEEEEDYEDGDSPREVPPPQQQRRQPPQPVQPTPSPPPHDSPYYNYGSNVDPAPQEDEYDDEYPVEEEPEYTSRAAPPPPQQQARQPMPPPSPNAEMQRRRDSPPPQRQQPRHDAAVAAHRPTPKSSPPPPKQQRQAKQTQVQSRAHATSTQTRTTPPLPVTAGLPAPAPQPRRTSAGTQYDVESNPGSELRPPEPPWQEQQPARERALPARQSVRSPYDDEIPSLAVQRGARPPPSDDDDGDDDKEGVSAPPPPRQPPLQPYSPAVMHNAKREPLRYLVEPSEAYPLDVNGAPAFLPPLPYRAGLGPSGVPLAPYPERGALVARVPSRGEAPRSDGALQLYNPRNGDPNAQPGMPMTLPSPANGYPRHTQLAPPLPPPPLRKVTRDHKIIKTRIVRTYRRGPATDSEDGTQADEEEVDGDERVFQHESGSSWETSGSVSWAATRSSRSEESGSAGVPADAASSAATSPRQHHSHTRERKPSSSAHPKMVIKRPKGTGAESARDEDGNNMAPKHHSTETAAKTKRPPEGGDDDSAMKPEVINASVQHHVKHKRRSTTTTTVRHLDDSTEM